MENKPSNLHESLWRRPLSAAERKALRCQPDVELEARLTEALTKVPDVSVPSNFTARVLNAIELEEKQAAHTVRHWNWRRLLPRIALATAVLLFAGIAIHRYELNSQRVALAREVATVAASQPLPSVEALENLDVIQHMSQSGHADTELLAALQ